MPQINPEIDPRKQKFLGHFHPEDRQIVIAWTFGRLRRRPEITAEDLAKGLRSELKTEHVKDVYPYLRERLLFIFEARPHVITDWAAWCIEWQGLTPDEKKEARERFEMKRALWGRK